MNQPSVGTPMPAKFLMRQEADWTDSMVVIAFPTAGNAGNIAGHYLRKELGLPLLGSIHLDGQPGVVAVEEGIAAAPVRIFGGELECNLGDAKCPSIHLIVTDLPLGPAATEQVAEAIIEETRGARLLLCLDAVVRDEDDDTPDVYCTAPDEAILSKLETDQVQRLPGGILVGLSGHLLLEAERADLPAAALLVEATKNLPDGYAAAALVRAVDHLIPQVPVDPKPLLAEAEELENFVKQAQKDAESHQRRPHLGSYI